MKTIDASGLHFAVEDQGQGPPLLLVHGFPFDHTMWNSQVAALAGRQRVIAPDLRGFGQTTAVPGGIAPAKVTMEQFADDLSALLDALKVSEPAHLCGLSMGGYVAFQFWLKYASRLKSLILCDTKATADTPDAARGRLVMAEQVLHDGLATAAATMLPKLVSPQALAQKSPAAEAVRAMILRAPPAGVAAAQRGMAERPDMTRYLSKIDLPVLLVVGEHDAISPPAEMRSMAAEIRGSRLVIIPAAGHVTPVEAPAAVNAAIAEFLCEHK